MKINKLILGLGISVAAGLFSVSILGGSKQAMKASAEAGDAPTGVEADWTPVTSVSDINTSDYYMLRTTYNDSYQYSNSELDFVNGVAWRAASFENARVFQFVEGTDGYKVKGLFNLPPEEIENYHYLHITDDEYEDLWTVNTLEEAAEFDAFAYDGTKITLRKHGSTSLLAALPVIYDEHAGETTIINLSSEDYEFYSDQGFLIPLELVTCASVTPVLPTSLELKVNDKWASDGARFAAYFFGKDEEIKWVDMTLVSGGNRLYEVDVPEGFTSVIFCRMNGDNPLNDWSNRINQTGNLSIADGDYYLMYDDSWDTGVWYEGTESVYVRGDFSSPEWTIDEDYRLTWNKFTGQYEIKDFCDALDDGNSFKIYNQSDNLWIGYADEGMTNDYSLFTEGAEANIVIHKDTYLDIYYKPLHDLLWIEESAWVVADEFAKAFLSTTNGICIDSSKSTSDTDIDALAAVWNIKETPDGSSLVEKWNALSIGAKAAFNEGTATDDIIDAKARYVHIMSRYSEQLTAFAEGPVYVAKTEFMVGSDLTNNTALIVTIVVAVAISTLSLATLLVIKKRRS